MRGKILGAWPGDWEELVGILAEVFHLGMAPLDFDDRDFAFWIARLREYKVRHKKG